MSGAVVASFMFHEVSDDPATTGFQRSAARHYKHTPAAFGAYLDAIGSAATPTILPQIDLSQPGRDVLLTFDDGGKSARTAASELERRGWRGHFFVVTSLVGARGFATAEDIRAIHRAGHVVGSHSHTHPDIFRDLTFDRAVEEWRTSADWLSQLLGAPCVSASVPGGDISGRVLDSAEAAGLRYLFTSEPWLRPRRRRECWVLGRFSVKLETSAAEVGRLACFRGWSGALARRRMKVVATRAIPPLYRLYVRLRTRSGSGD